MLYGLVERYKHCEKSCSIYPKDCNLHINNFQNFRSHAINKILSTIAEKKMWYLEITVLLTAHENIHNKMYHNHKTFMQNCVSNYTYFREILACK